MFSMDHAGEYRVMLQVRSSTGATSEYSKLIRTMGSTSTASISIAQPPPVNESFSDRFTSWFNSFPLLMQAAFIVMVVFLCMVSFDAVFHVSRGWRKKMFYSTKEMER